MIRLIEADFWTGADLAESLTDLADIIVTDPPYAKEHLSLYDCLGWFGSVVLKRTGSLVTIVPHRHLGKALELVGAHLEYRWCMAMMQIDPPWAQMNLMGVQVKWKPLVWFVNECMPRQKGYRPDAFLNPAPKKDWHEWQQSRQWAEFCLGFMPPDGKVVVDPMMGTGTVALECLLHGYDFIGIDKDPEMIERAYLRLLGDGVPEAHMTREVWR